MIWIQLTSTSINQSSQQKKTIGFNDLKLVVFTAYNLWQPKWMLKESSEAVVDNESQLEQANRNPSIASSISGGHFKYDSKADFDRFHKRVKVFLANRSQNDYYRRTEDLEERAKRFDYDFRSKHSPAKQPNVPADTVIQEEKVEDEEKRASSNGQQQASALTPSRVSAVQKQVLQSKISPKMPSMRSPEQPPQYFKPRINKKSEVLDKKVTSKYQMSQTSRVTEGGAVVAPSGKSAERPNLIL